MRIISIHSLIGKKQHYLADPDLLVFTLNYAKKFKSFFAFISQRKQQTRCVYSSGLESMDSIGLN